MKKIVKVNVANSKTKGEMSMYVISKFYILCFIINFYN